MLKRHSLQDKKRKKKGDLDRRKVTVIQLLDRELREANTPKPVNGKKVFLTLNDPLFSQARVPVNVSGDIYVTAPKQQYDALFLLPVAQRDFVGD